MAAKAQINIDKGKIIANYGLYSKHGEGMSSYYIPAFNIFFSADTNEKAQKRANNMVYAFFEYWTKSESNRSFFLELHKLGFRTEKHNYRLKQLLNNEIRSAIFGLEMDISPADYNEREEIQTQGELALA